MNLFETERLLGITTNKQKSTTKIIDFNGIAKSISKWYGAAGKIVKVEAYTNERGNGKYNLPISWLSFSTLCGYSSD